MPSVRRLGTGGWVAIALVAGLAAGIVAGGREPASAPFLKTAETIGTLWVNAIRMTVIPLIVALLVVGVAAARTSASVGTLGVRAFAFFYVSLIAVAAGTALVAPAAFEWLVLDPAAVAALRASVAGSTLEGAATVPTFADWLISVVPTNPFAAAASGALLPLIVFVLGFAYALTRVDDPGRSTVVGFFRGVADAMMVLVGWVLLLAPVGVLALTYVLGTRLGAGVVGAIGLYVVVQSVLLILSALVMYPIVAAAGRCSITRFARAVLPAQVVAVTTRSSFAALPAGLEGARRLGIPASVAGFVMPLAVAIFRYSSPIQWIVGAAFVARIYGIEFGLAELLTVTVASVLLNATVPGIPSGGLLVQAPVYAAVGLPVEGLAILIAVDLVPDLFRTAANATGHLAAAAVLAGTTAPLAPPQNDQPIPA